MGFTYALGMGNYLVLPINRDIFFANNWYHVVFTTNNNHKKHWSCNIVKIGTYHNKFCNV